jgi:hypothetical protein
MGDSVQDAKRQIHAFEFANKGGVNDVNDEWIMLFSKLLNSNLQ